MKLQIATHKNIINVDLPETQINEFIIKIKQAEINQAVYINFLNHLNNTSFLKLRIFIIY